MEFEGHDFKKIDDNWVFDLTTFIGYKVVVNDKNEVVDYLKSYIAIRDNNSGCISFDKKCSIPTSVLRKTVDIIHTYRKEALLDGR